MECLSAGLNKTRAILERNWNVFSAANMIYSGVYVCVRAVYIHSMRVVMFSLDSSYSDISRAHLAQQNRFERNLNQIE